ncbi:uncharacterized protein LOC128134145 [Lactuca sativa]|uniref:uncharacterized protein LOC128134145 n=1 Tax=Lactuca sativa TaxID=4236 RepID=UPI0022AE5D08|nr:uncharacterized protein LOC128134145 [Lactuca sativa]
MGELPDSIGDYMRMYERTAKETLYRSARGVVETFNDVYLRKPSLNGMQQLYVAHEERHGFSGKTSDAHFTVSENEYKFVYYITDEIYPSYSTFVKVFRHLVELKDKFFKRRQEGVHKDVKRTFGVLKK